MSAKFGKGQTPPPGYVAPPKEPEKTAIASRDRLSCSLGLTERAVAEATEKMKADEPEVKVEATKPASEVAAEIADAIPEKDFVAKPNSFIAPRGEDQAYAVPEETDE